MGWNRIANVQKGKIINCYSGQQIDLRSFFPIIEGNFMVLGSVASARADGIRVGGLRAVVEDLGNYNYRGWVQANSFDGSFDGTALNTWLNVNETHHLGTHYNIRGYGISWQVQGDVYANRWTGNIKFWSDTWGDLAIWGVGSSGNGQTGTQVTFDLPCFDSNFWIRNEATMPIKYNFKPAPLNWRNIEGIVQLYVQQTVT